MAHLRFFAKLRLIALHKYSKNTAQKFKPSSPGAHASLLHALPAKTLLVLLRLISAAGFEYLCNAAFNCECAAASFSRFLKANGRGARFGLTAFK